MSGQVAPMMLAYGAGDLFMKPLPVWDYWYLLLLPLCAAVAIVYKSMKAEELKDLPKRIAINFAWIVFGMVCAAAVLGVVVRWLDH